MLTSIFATGKLSRLVLVLAASLLVSACDLKVVATTGGTVTSSPAMINCRADGGTCLVRNYEDMRKKFGISRAQLIATPDAGYRLSHWNGCDSTERLHCWVNLDSDIEVKAVFKPLDYATDGDPNVSLRFVAVGDFGTGAREQELVANAMGSVCNQKGGCEFAIGLGDNIYDENPQSPYEDAFDRKFEQPMRNANFPFYMALGNHDNSLIIDGIGNWNRTGEIQVEYSHRNDRATDRWIMPSRYYQHSHPENSGAPTATFLALDSNPFMTVFEIDPEYWVWYEWNQGEWARNALAGSNAQWKIAYGHHPYLSNGMHGNAGNYEGIKPIDLFTRRFSGENYRRWLEKNICGKVDLFVAGHDHDLQLLHSIPECGNTIFMISGAGAKTRQLEGDATRNPFIYQQGNVLGFVIAEIQGNSITITFYTVSPDDGVATVAHKQTFKRRLRAG